MKTETTIWAIVDKSAVTHVGSDGKPCLLTSRDEARSMRRSSETVKRVKVTIEDA